MARASATDRLGRILAIVPWIAEQDGPRIDHVCERFGMTRVQLLDDLAIVPFVGRYPYTPENLIEVDIDDDRVWIRYMNFFERPLRLSRDEALALIASGTASAAQVGHDPEGPLARGLAKVADVLGIDLEDDLRVVLGDEPSDGITETIRNAVREHRVLQLDYFSHARNEQTQRSVEPLRLFHTEGAWYLDAYCRRSEAERVFRLDRVTGAVASDEAFEPPETHRAPAAFDPDHRLPRVVLELEPEGRWAAEQYPVDSSDELGGGRLRVTLAVSAGPWLARVLLRLGPYGRVVDAPPELASVGADAATRLLSRYGATTTTDDRDRGGGWDSLDSE